MALIQRTLQIMGRNFSVFGDQFDQTFLTTANPCIQHDALFGLVGTPRVILDVGANIGLFSIAAHVAFPGAKITAVEPSPVVLPALQRNTGSFAEIVNGALGETAGQMLFNPGGPMNVDRSGGAHLMNDAHW